ncbi:TolC family protein [Sphingobacterium sp. LRF_L2]|uniref:TolC family protein n=1 Tax=Sphingobacterium sp. LRF_L2 TaxID=3369421 RepID=UPI003F63150E
MIRKLFLSLCLSLILLGASTLHSFAQVTLEEAVKTTLERNLQIRQAQFGYDLSEQDLKLSKADRLPDLSLQTSSSFNYGYSFDQIAGQVYRNLWTNSLQGGLSSNVALFQGFQKINQIKANKIQLSIDKSEVERVKNDLILSVITTYLEAVTNGELHEAAIQQVSLSKEQLRLDSIQYAVGNKTLADLSQSENQVALDEVSVITTENALGLSMLNLKQLMEIPQETEMELVRPQVDEVVVEAISTDLREIYNKALAVQPQITQAEQKKDLAAQNIKTAKGGYLPTLSLTTSYGTGYSSQNFERVAVDDDPLNVELRKKTFGDQFNENRSFNIGLSLSVPIYDKQRTKVSIAKAKINQQMAETESVLAQRNLEKIVIQAVLDLKAANKQYISSRVSFNSSQVAFNVIKERYEVGMANAMEMFTAQTNMNKAEFDMIRAKYETIFKSRIIDYYLGNTIDFENY